MHALRVSRKYILANKPVKYHFEFFSLLCVQLPAVGIGGLDNLLRVDRVVVEACRGQGRPRRAKVWAIGRE